MNNEQLSSQNEEQLNNRKQKITNLQQNNKLLGNLLNNIDYDPIPPPPSFNYGNDNNPIPSPPSFNYRNAPYIHECSSEIEEITESINEPRELKKDFIKIHIKPLSANRTRTFYLSKFAKIIDIKSKYLDRTGSPINQQEYFFGGNKLQNDHCLNDYYVENNSTILLCFVFRYR